MQFVSKGTLPSVPNMHAFKYIHNTTTTQICAQTLAPNRSTCLLRCPTPLPLLHHPEFVKQDKHSRGVVSEKVQWWPRTIIEVRDTSSSIPFHVQVHKTGRTTAQAVAGTSLVKSGGYLLCWEAPGIYC